MSDVGKLRAQLDDFVADEAVVRLGDEAWYDRLWELLDPVIDAQAKRSLAANTTPKGELPDWARDTLPVLGLDD